MSIYSDVFPTSDSPNKFQMEALFDRIRPESVTDAAVRDFKLIKEYGKWRINTPLNTARRFFRDFYAKLDKTDKLLFQIPYLNSGIQYVRSIMENMAEAGVKEIYDLLPRLSPIHTAVFDAIMPVIEDAMAKKYGIDLKTGEKVSETTDQ